MINHRIRIKVSGLGEKKGERERERERKYKRRNELGGRGGGREGKTAKAGEEGRERRT